MAVYRLLREPSFGPDEISQMTAAYEQALQALKLVDRNDPITEILAKKVIEIARLGEPDRTEISARGIQDLGWEK
jgi:hypothetical protein